MNPTRKTGYTGDQKTRFSDKFKATVALETRRGDRTVQEIAARHKVHPTQVTTGKRQAIDGLTGVFSDKVRRAEGNEAEPAASTTFKRVVFESRIFLARMHEEVLMATKSDSEPQILAIPTQRRAISWCYT